MGKLKTKSILSCAVLASVLAGGFFVSVAEAAQVKALVAPKDFGTLIGQNIAFGQQRGYVENQTVTYPDGIPTWQIVAGDNGGITLLANQAWGYNRFSDSNRYETLVNPGARVTILYYEEALKYLNDHSEEFFSAEGIVFLQNQTVSEAWNQVRYKGKGECGENKFTSIFALPTMEQVNVLEEEKRKRDFVYWLADGYTFVGDIVYDPEDFHQTCDMRYDANTVQADGSIVEKAGQNQNYIFPTIELSLPTFAMYGDKTGYDNVFKIHNIEDTAPLRLTFKNTNKEKNINISKLSVAQEGITFDAKDLATEEGQGIGGLVEDANGNYLAYARFADSTNGMAENVKIKFDSSITGNNTIHLFNEWIGDKYDLAGNYYEMCVKTENSKISAFTNKWDVTYDELTIGKGVNYTAEGSSNVTVKNKFVWENSNGNKLVNITNVDNGYIHLGGAFSVKNPDNATVTNRTLKLTKTGNVWNNMDLYGINGGVMAMNVDLNSLYMERGTFTIQGNLKAADYLQLRDGAELTIGGTVEAKRLEVNGALNLVADGAVTDETHLCNDSTLKLTGSNKILNLQKSLTTDDGAKITGVDSSDKVVIDENLTAKGDITLDKITLIVGKNIQVEGNINATTGKLSVKNSLNLANGNAQGGTIGTLTFGERWKSAVYAFDLGMDKLNISTSASGKVKLAPKYGIALSSGGTVDVFTGSGDVNNLILADARVTNMANNKTYILIQHTDNKGQLNVKATKYNAVVNFADAVKGQKVAFGNYWQDNSNAKQPVVWSCVKQDNEQSVFLSDKILAETGGRVGDSQMWKITNFLKQDGAFAKDLFTTGELAILDVNNYGDVLGLPSYDDVKDGGNYGWNVDGRKAQVSSYAGNGGRYYALGSTHYWAGDHINDWVDSSNGGIGTSKSLWSNFSDGSHYGIRPTISFDTAAVLFATNAEGGKGSCDVGNITKLQDVDSTSTLELTIDDAYIAEKTGTARKTGDVRVGVRKLAVGKDSIKTDYYTTYKDNNSYLSLFIGDAALPQDIFGYGKLAQVAQSGNGDLTLNLNDFTAKFADESVSGLALRFVNEYGSGTSLVGEFYDYGKMYLKDGKMTLDLPVRNLPRYDLFVAKGSKLIIRGTGKEDIISGDSHYLQIKGDGTVAFDNVVFSNKNLSEGMDVEVNDATLRVEIDNRYENGQIVLKTADIVSLNSVKGMDGTNKIFLDIARMGIGFNETQWATNTSKTLLCLDAITNDVEFNFDGGYVVVGSEEMYEFKNGSKNGEVNITRKKFGNGQFNDGDGGPFTSSWFKDYASSSLLGDFVCKAGDNAFRNFDLSGGAKNFTVNGNGHKFNGGVGANGIVITKPESSFTLKNISEISGFKDFAFRNGGILNIIGETLLRGNILNYEEVLPVLTAAPVLMATPGMQEVVGTTNIDGTLIVDEPITIENNLNFEDNSALKVFGSALNEGATISGVDSLTVGENVALQFDPDGLKSLNGNYSVFDEKADIEEVNKFQLDKGSIENIGTVFDANFAEGKIAVSWNSDMANFGENLGVSRGAYTVAGLMGTAVQRHLKGKNTANLSSTLNPEPSTLERNSVWATYIHNKDKVDGLNLGFSAEAKYDAQYNGTIVGYDFNHNSGVALAYVDGNTSNGYGGHNDGKHYGVSVYSKKKLGKAILSGDISYIHGKNELRQDINWENVKADAKTNTYSAGLHIANPVKLGQGTVTPFAGLRYMHINGKEYRNNLGVTYEGDKMNIFTAPFGLNYQVTVEDEKSGWTVTPSIEVGYAFNFGDRNNDMTVGYKTAKDSFGYDVTDKGYVFLQGGLNFTKKNLTMGVGYDFTKSSNSHNNRWNVNLTWSF